MAVTCPRCQSANIEDAKFCQNCGLALSVTCPNCGTANMAGARFCHNCGFALTGGQIASSPGTTNSSATHEEVVISPQDRLHEYLPDQLRAKLDAVRDTGPRRSVEPERRIVTVLFCDVKGSTALADQLDPEDWAAIMNDAFTYLITPVYRYEGTLARLLGDAILAFFGAPIAHEDDPQRAVLAGLEIIEGIQEFRERMRRERGLEFNVRVGINTGLVVVGDLGSDLRVEYTAMGDAVNLASRMETTAEPGTVQISESTYRAVARLFEIDALGSITVRGKTEPVPAYRVRRARPGVVSTRGFDELHSPLVGRDRDLQALRDQVDHLLDGQGRIVAVIGDAGLGKSRLVAELRHLLVAGGLLDEESGFSDRMQWCEGRSLSYETMTPYAPFISMLSNSCGLTPDFATTGAYDRIEEQVRYVVPDNVHEIAPYLATLVGVPVPSEEQSRIKYLTPPQLRDLIFAAVEQYITALASRKPLILTFEDLHWADPTSRDLIERLMRLPDLVQLMLLAVFRPQRHEPSWRFHEVATRDYPHRYVTIHLDPLADDDARQLVANLLPVDGLPEQIRRVVLDRAEGNPFYVEEVLRSLLDAGVIVRQGSTWIATREIETLSIPTTLTGVLTARLDRLDEPTRSVVGIAAVIGREFAFDILRSVEMGLNAEADLEEPLRELQRRELIRERVRFPERIYRFKHVLTQEAAYNSLLLSRRRDLHLRVAQAIEVAASDHDGHHPVLAQHYALAERWDKALEHAEHAALAAQEAYANVEALGYLDQAFNAADRLGAGPDIRLRLNRLSGQIHVTLGDYESAYRRFEAALELARDAQDRHAEWQALVDIGCYWLGLDYRRAGSTFEQALSLAHVTHDQPAIAESLTQLGSWQLNLEMIDDAEQTLKQALDLFESLDDQGGVARTVDLLGTSADIGGDIFLMRSRYEKAAAMFRALDDRQGLSSCLATMSLSTITTFVFETVALPSGPTLELGVAEVNEALSLAEEIDWRSGQAYAHVTLSSLLAQSADFDRARAAAERGLSLAREIGHAEWIAMGAAVSSLILGELFAWDEAVEHLEQSVEAARASGAANMINVTLSGLIRIYATSGRVDEAERLLETIDPQLPMRTIGQRSLWMSRAVCALVRDDPISAIEILDRLFATALNFEHEASIPSLAFLRAQALVRVERQSEAATLLTATRDQATSRSHTTLLWRIDALLARLYQSKGQTMEAETAAASAWETVDRIARNVSDVALRTGFVRGAAGLIPGTLPDWVHQALANSTVEDPAT